MVEYDFKLCNRKDIQLFIEENHYSKSINGVKVSYCFSIHDVSGNLVGACLFGQLSTTAWKKFGECEKDVLELRRLVTLDTCPRNTESWFISKCINWIRKNTKVKILVSYADPMYGHIGYVYQASNWVYCGVSGKDKGFKDPETGKIYHSRALRTKYKGDYKPFVKILRDKLDNGNLHPIDLKGKYCYTYNIKGKNIHKLDYPKGGYSDSIVP